MNRTALFRTWGDCYGYLLLASGMADIMIDPVMHVWDLAALIPVIRDAGGIITDWSGKDAFTGNSCVAAGAKLHHIIIDILNS
jgi:myo-inositol-1(or 4)-monophosphatase